MAALYRSFYILKLLSKQAVVFDHNLTDIINLMDKLTISECLFFIIVFDIQQLNKLWKKTFRTVNRLSCFAGQHV